MRPLSVDNFESLPCQPGTRFFIAISFFLIFVVANSECVTPLEASPDAAGRKRVWVEVNESVIRCVTSPLRHAMKRPV